MPNLNNRRARRSAADAAPETADPKHTLLSSTTTRWLIGLALGILAVVYLVHRSNQMTGLARFETEGGEILNAAASWRQHQPALGCPTLSQLIQDQFLPKSIQAGGKRYRIVCSTDEVHVEQLGEDGKPQPDAPRLNHRIEQQSP